ncbi:MAG: AbrB/MazE/SpoVT family DNA-binding domain-containing protein [Thermoleophilia bacterium]|nr:AbrB/MazE/SpoVT family DNA-binding domain-containing protein [Thermoleophilia bacterium]
MLAKRTSKNQITLPVAIAREFPDVQYFDVRREGGVIVLEPVHVTRGAEAVSRAEAVRERLAELGITDEDVQEAVRWARGQ